MSENGDNLVYVYGVLRARASDDVEGKGIDDRPLELVTSNGIAALTSGVASEQLEAGKDELLAHTRTLERALDWGPVLPMRFGTVMGSEDEVRERLLGAHGPELERQLDEMEGKVEISIRGIYDEAMVLREILEANPEAAELREATAGASEAATYPERIRLGEVIAEEMTVRRETDSQAIVDRLGQVAAGARTSEPVHERMAVGASFLVERERLEEFDRVLDEIANEQGGRIRFNYIGPLPPHSFVELSLGEA